MPASVGIIFMRGLKMLEHIKEDNTDKFKTSDDEMIGIVDFDNIAYSIFVVGKDNNSATVTVTKSELKQIYDKMGELLK